MGTSGFTSKHLVVSAVLISLGFCLAVVEAEDIVGDPEVDFIHTPETVRAEFGILMKDRILRLDLDLKGDCQLTSFFASEGGGSKSGFVWAAYSPKASGFVRTDGIQFREDLIARELYRA